MGGKGLIAAAEKYVFVNLNISGHKKHIVVLFIAELGTSATSSGNSLFAS
jgi:hypothetical protein